MLAAFLLTLTLVSVPDARRDCPFPSWEEAAAYLAGAVEMEELDGETLERYGDLFRKPLKLNNSSRSAMLSSGLLTPYQVASILDVRSRTGPILSFTELAMIDGIGERTAAALRYFLTLEAVSPVPESGRFSGEISVRAGAKKDSSAGRSWKDAQRVKVEFGNRLSASVGTSAAYDRKRVETASVSLTSRDGRLSVLAGDLNARFGQGLVMWSGMTMSGVSGIESVVRKGGGVSASASFTGSGRMRGAALDFDSGPSRISVLASEKCFAANGNRYWKRSQAGVTAVYGEGVPAASVDFRCNVSGVDLWGEAAVEVAPDVRTSLERRAAAPAGLAGVSWSPKYGTAFAAFGRVYPQGYRGAHAGALRSATKTSDESGVCIAGKCGAASFCSDYAFHPSNGRRQMKTVLLADPSFPIGDATLTPSLRHALRWRPYETPHFRNDLRADADLVFGIWQFHGRYNTLWYRSRSWAWYCEAVVCDPERRFQASARAGLFKVDNWDDRIYVYERDLPGCFTVPSLYGRGWNASMTAGARWHPKERYRPARRLDMRSSIISYPWTRPLKPSRFEIRAQYSVSW